MNSGNENAESKGSVVINNWKYKKERLKWNYLNIIFNKYNVPLEIIDIIKKYVLINHSLWDCRTKTYGERFKDYVNHLEGLNIDILKLNYKIAKNIEIKNNELHDIIHTNKKEIEYKIDESNEIYGELNLHIRECITCEDEEYFADETLCGYCCACDEEIEIPAWNEEYTRFNRHDDCIWTMECRQKGCEELYNEETNEKWRCQKCWDKYFFKDDETTHLNYQRWNICLNCSNCYRDNNGNVCIMTDSEEEDDY